MAIVIDDDPAGTGEIDWRERYNTLKERVGKALGLPESDYVGPIHRGHDAAVLLDKIRELKGEKR